MAESALQKKIINHLKRKGWYVVKIVMSNTNGIPDIWIGKNGNCAWLEIKDKGKTAEPLQLQRHKELDEKGFNVFVIDTWEKYLELKPYEKS
jgi:Holliday junction resolvase